MKVLFSASEYAPIAKVGGLGDVIRDLPKALTKIGVDASVIIPFYEQIDRKKWKPKLILKLGNQTSVYKTFFDAPKKVETFLVYNKKYLSTGPIYFEKTAFVGSQREINRFMFFSKAVYELLKHPKFFKPDIVHCNDWHTGFLVKLLKSEFQTPKVVFTIHNLANQGRTNSATLAKWLGVHESAHANKGANLMAEGIKNADKVTTVSPTYAKEILTPKYGEGLENILQKRQRDLIGILNGIDYNEWPLPEGLKRLPHKFPSFGFVARLTRQKGLDLLIPLVSRLIRQENAKFYFLGQGQEKYEKTLLDLAKKYPENVKVKIGFDEKLARKIYAESDFFLMPSIFEPCGLGQIISMRYGTIPIVRATGGLKDAVKNLKTGFVFKLKTSAALYGAIQIALKYFYSPERLERLRKNCLKQNFSWINPAKEYKKLYDEI